MSNNYPEVVYWLALINQSGLKLSLVKPIIQRWCIAEQRPLTTLFNLPPLDLSTNFGLSDVEAQKIVATTDKLNNQAVLIAQWQTQGFEPIISTDPRYPQRLIYNLPPAKHPLMLWARGPIDLLNRPGITMLGQQDPDQTTITFINQLMISLEAEAIGLVSGYSRGLDRSIFDTMLASENGFGVAVLPMGLNAFIKTSTKLEQAVQSGQVVLVSPFSPDTPFNEKLADARNLLIDHMTLALLIPESNEHVRARAITALERGLPVFVKADTASNRTLLDQGALLLTDSGEVIEWVQQALVDIALTETAPESDDINSAAAPLITTAPADPPSSNDDYSLRPEDIPLLDSEEAIEVLSLGGKIPEVLRQRLQKPDEDR